MDAIAKFRANFGRPLNAQGKRLIQLNNAGMAPIPRATLDVISTYSKRLYEEGVFVWEDLYPEMLAARRKLADFLGASFEEVAFFSSTANAISQVAFGLDLQAGDEIIVWDQEYPSNLYPWFLAAERSGAKLVRAASGPQLETPADRLLSHVTNKTKVIAFSWVQYRTGAITEIEEVTRVAKERGIFTCCDIIQGAGFLPFNFRSSGLDAACGGSHKWLVSTVSTGFFLLRKERLKDVTPLMVGAMTYGGPDEFFSPDAKIQDSAKRFEPGARSILDTLAFGASLSLLQETGIARISQEVEWLSRTLQHGLHERGYITHSPHGRHHRGSIVNFSPGPDAAFKPLSAIELRLKEIGAAFAIRSPGIRLSPHAFNTAEDIQLVLEALH